ncbi:MAG: SHOCT domain-containing protein, partial [Actinomycetota bacterium]|nr:SHOCT domain-containing protein [Actinomycetota bacterium]
GDLLIESAGESGQSRFSDVRKPDAVQNEIYRQVEAQRGRATGTPIPAVDSPAEAPQSAEGSIARQIEELDELRRKGLVSEEEFEAKRHELLDRM